MRRQRNRSQVKEHNEIPEKEPNKMETSTPPDTEFKTLILRMLNELRWRVDELSESYNKEIGNKKMNQSDIKNTIT